jgi:hypothetical protein
MRILIAALIGGALAGALPARAGPLDPPSGDVVGTTGTGTGVVAEQAPAASAPPAYPHCLARFRAEIDERRLAAESQLVGGALGAGSAASSSYEVAEAEGDVQVALVLLASLASPSTTTLAASPIYFGLGIADVLRMEDRRRVFRALQEAQVGDGLVLRDLAIEVALRGTSAHPGELARLLRTAPEPCRGELMTWDALVIWTSSAVLALPR